MERIVIADCRSDDKTIYSLEKIGLTVIPTKLLANLYDGIASHADMQIHYLGNNRFICAPEAYLHYKKWLPVEFDIIKGSAALDSTYPQDIAYNTASFGNFVICNTGSTAIEILSEYQSMSQTILNVNQGYSKCNICIVNNNSIITSDEGIARTALKENINILKINAGHIKLRNMNYGFIGGATGLIEKNILAVNGSINTHPDGDVIKEFCKKQDVELYELKEGILEDIGSIISNLQV